MKKKKEILISSRLGLKGRIKRWCRDLRNLWREKSVIVVFAGVALLRISEWVIPYSKYKFWNIFATIVIWVVGIILVVYIESKKHKS